MADDKPEAGAVAELAFFDLFLAEVRRRLLDESLPRLRKCLGMLSEEDIWYRHHERVNSVGNLVLHLCGNARQWMGSGLAGWPDERDRDAEFAERGPVSRAHLLERIADTEQMMRSVLDGLSPQQLRAVHQVQVFEETGIAILVHVVEHFSYHVGQVTYFVKAQLGEDTGYYGDLNLNTKA